MTINTSFHSVAGVRQLQLPEETKVKLHCCKLTNTHLSQCEISSRPWTHAQKMQLQHTHPVQNRGRNSIHFLKVSYTLLWWIVLTSCSAKIWHILSPSCVLNKDKALQNKARLEQNNTGLHNLRLSWNIWARGLTWSHKICLLVYPNFWLLCCATLMIFFELVVCLWYLGELKGKDWRADS